jgi:hypothetical protein
MQLKELRYHYITAKSELMYQGRQSEVATRAGHYGLRETMHPPYKIMYTGKAINTKKEK